MNSCPDLYFLSAIACQLSECLTEDELAILAASLTALGDMLEVLVTRREVCQKEDL